MKERCENISFYGERDTSKLYKIMLKYVLDVAPARCGLGSHVPLAKEHNHRKG